MWVQNVQPLFKNEANKTGKCIPEQVVSAPLTIMDTYTTLLKTKKRN